MLTVQHKLPDNVEDPISKVLVPLNARRTWDLEKQQLFEKLGKLLVKHRYKQFTGDCRDYDLTRKGQACLYDVPGDQRGFLHEYRNKRVRLVCMGGLDAYSGRRYRVKQVPRSTVVIWTTTPAGNPSA